MRIELEIVKMASDDEDAELAALRMAVLSSMKKEVKTEVQLAPVVPCIDEELEEDEELRALREAALAGLRMKQPQPDALSEEPQPSKVEESAPAEFGSTADIPLPPGQCGVANYHQTKGNLFVIQTIPEPEPTDTSSIPLPQEKWAGPTATGAEPPSAKPKTTKFDRFESSNNESEDDEDVSSSSSSSSDSSSGSSSESDSSSDDDSQDDNKADEAALVANDAGSAPASPDAPEDKTASDQPPPVLGDTRRVIASDKAAPLSFPSTLTHSDVPRPSKHLPSRDHPSRESGRRDRRSHHSSKDLTQEEIEERLIQLNDPTHHAHSEIRRLRRMPRDKQENRLDKPSIKDRLGFEVRQKNRNNDRMQGGSGKENDRQQYHTNNSQILKARQRKFAQNEDFHVQKNVTKGTLRTCRSTKEGDQRTVKTRSDIDNINANAKTAPKVDSHGSDSADSSSESLSSGLNDADSDDEVAPWRYKHTGKNSEKNEQLFERATQDIEQEKQIRQKQMMEDRRSKMEERYARIEKNRDRDDKHTRRDERSNFRSRDHNTWRNERSRDSRPRERRGSRDRNPPHPSSTRRTVIDSKMKPSADKSRPSKLEKHSKRSGQSSREDHRNKERSRDSEHASRDNRLQKEKHDSQREKDNTSREKENTSHHKKSDADEIHLAELTRQKRELEEQLKEADSDSGDSDASQEKTEVQHRAADDIGSDCSPSRKNVKGGDIKSRLGLSTRHSEDNHKDRKDIKSRLGEQIVSNFDGKHKDKRDIQSRLGDKLDHETDARLKKEEQSHRHGHSREKSETFDDKKHDMPKNIRDRLGKSKAPGWSSDSDEGQDVSWSGDNKIEVKHDSSSHTSHQRSVSQEKQKQEASERTVEPEVKVTLSGRLGHEVRERTVSEKSDCSINVKVEQRDKHRRRKHMVVEDVTVDVNKNSDAHRIIKKLKNDQYQGDSASSSDGEEVKLRPASPTIHITFNSDPRDGSKKRKESHRSQEDNRHSFKEDKRSVRDRLGGPIRREKNDGEEASSRRSQQHQRRSNGREEKVGSRSRRLGLPIRTDHDKVTGDRSQRLGLPVRSDRHDTDNKSRSRSKRTATSDGDIEPETKRHRSPSSTNSKEKVNPPENPTSSPTQHPKDSMDIEESVKKETALTGAESTEPSSKKEPLNGTSQCTEPAKKHKVNTVWCRRDMSVEEQLQDYDDDYDNLDLTDSPPPAGSKVSVISPTLSDISPPLASVVHSAVSQFSSRLNSEVSSRLGKRPARRSSHSSPEPVEKKKPPISRQPAVDKEHEAALDARIRLIREKNAAALKRQQEIEADKKKYG